MIGHQAICPDRDLLCAAKLRHELEVAMVIFLTEERLLSAVSPLGDMVGHARSYHTGSQFGVSSSLLLPLHQVSKLDSWEDFQDRQAMTLFTTRSTAGTTKPMSSAPRANGICSLAISPAPRHGTLSRSSATA